MTKGTQMASVVHFANLRIKMEDENARLIRDVVQKIVAAGDTVWLPVDAGVQDNGEKLVMDLLITPGIQIYVTSDDDESAQDAFSEILDDYLKNPVAPDEPTPHASSI